MRQYRHVLRSLVILSVVACGLLFPRASYAQVQVTVDYSKQIANGSPLIFGGTATPQWQAVQQLGWDKLQEVGVSFIRQDLSLESFVPNTTISDYNNNINNVQDPNTWHQGGREYIINKFLDAKKRGMKTMAIVDYAPAWLTYTGTQYGVPKDWNVWEDLVKKTITNFKNTYGVQIDYYEVWNEPGDEWQDQFFDVTGSGMTKQDAYIALYLHTWNAIKAVDPNAKIGGPADYQPDSAVKLIRAMLSSSLINNKIDFVSYHYYNVVHEYIIESPSFFNLPAGTNSSVPIANLLKQLGRTEIPIILSEYNYTCCGRAGSAATNDSLAFDAGNFVDLLRYGILGANYFTTSSDFCTSAQQYLCFYQIINSAAVLQPEGHLWRLASKQLGLGSGPSRVFQTTEPAGIKAIGAINANGQPVIFISNGGSTAQNVMVTLNNPTVTGTLTSALFLANINSDPLTPSQTSTISPSNGNYVIQLSIPSWTSAGVVLSALSVPTVTPTTGLTSTPTRIPTIPMSTSTPIPSNTPSPTPVPGDGNNDRKVDGLDYVIWLANYGKTTGGGITVGDFNTDGKIDGLDYVMWLAHYGS